MESRSDSRSKLHDVYIEPNFPESPHKITRSSSATSSGSREDSKDGEKKREVRKISSKCLIDSLKYIPKLIGSMSVIWREPAVCVKMHLTAAKFQCMKANHCDDWKSCDEFYVALWWPSTFVWIPIAADGCTRILLSAVSKWDLKSGFWTAILLKLLVILQRKMWCSITFYESYLNNLNIDLHSYDKSANLYWDYLDRINKTL